MSALAPAPDSGGPSSQRLLGSSGMRESALSNSSKTEVLDDERQTQEDLAFMRMALELADEAAASGEVPVGAVAVFQGRVVGRARNARETKGDPFAHAEFLAMAQAAESLGRWRLSGVSVYVTLEPCPMCAGALVNARVDRLVYGCDDPKTGAAGSVMNLVQHPALNHRLEVESGPLAEEASQRLRTFFRQRRKG